MKKRILLLTILASALAISACDSSNSSSQSSASSSFSSESSSSESSEITSSSVESSTSSSASEESSSSSSSSSSVSSSSSASESSSSIEESSSSAPISSSSSSEESSSSSSNSSSSSASSSASSEPSSSSSSSVPSNSSSDSSSSSSSSGSSSSTPIESSITANHASATYGDLYKNAPDIVSTTPSIGKANVLVIPVWFSDSDSYILEAKKELIREDIYTAYFGSEEETGWHSVKTYYEEESHGALTLEGTVSDWYVSEKASTYYANDVTVNRTISLVETVTDWYFTQNPSVSRTDYDEDGDGYLDGVMLIYGAPDQQALNKLSDYKYDNLWAYCFWTQNSSAKNIANPGANAFFWASYDFMYGKNKASSRTGKTYNNGDTSHCNIDTHTYIHEMGHMFGLDDYYDYSYQYNPAGGFSMQDSNVGGHDPFSSFALGWGKAYVPTETMTIDLRPFSETGEMILLTPNYNEYNSPFDEYLLLEYYTPTALNEFDTTYQYSGNYPQGSNDSGIRLWHVDARLFYESGNSFEFTTNPNDPIHELGEAFTNTNYESGNSEIEGYLSPLGDGYYDFNKLQLIRNNTTTNYKVKTDFNSNSLFKAGNSFNMNTYKRQFVNSGKLNQNIDLGFTFTVDATSSEYATITITKL